MAEILTEAMQQRKKLNERYRSARSNLLLVLAFTLINLVLMLVGSDSYFLFSAFVPYILVQFGMIFCGKLPEEFYIENAMETDFLDDSFLYITIALAVVCLVVYFLCWLLSKKQVGWLIASLVVFSVDTLALQLFNGITIDQIIDIIFHGGVIVSLSMGISAHFKLKKLPEEPVEESSFAEVPMEGAEAFVSDAVALRAAEIGVKERILAEGEALGHRIVYRRVKRTNELVIDGYVYGEYVALLEFNHLLSAKINGHLFEAEFNGTHSILRVDGEEIAKKLRLY